MNLLVKRGSLCLLAAAVLMPGMASAGGWSQNDTGAKRVGMSAVVGHVTDPTAIFHNPANIALVKGNELNASMLAGFAVASFKVELKDDAGQPYLSEVIRPVLNYGAFPFIGYTFDAGLEKWRFGVANYFPNFTGGSLEEDGPARYHLVEGFFASNFTSFAAAYKISEKVSVGLSVDAIYALTSGYQRLDVTSILPPDTPPGLAAIARQLGDVKVQLQVDEFKFGWHAGVNYRPAENVWFGMTYYERIDFDQEGDLRLILTGQGRQIGESLLGLTQITTAVSENNLAPRTVKVGAWFKVNEKWSWAWDLYWWDYSKFQQKKRKFPNAKEDLEPIPLVGPVLYQFLGPGLYSPKLYQDSWQVCLGAEHTLNEEWKLRFGFAYDDSPIPNETFSIDSLTSDSYTWQIGFDHKLNERTNFAMGYQYISFAKRKISNSLTDPPTNGRILESATHSVMAEVRHRW